MARLNADNTEAKFMMSLLRQWTFLFFCFVCVHGSCHHPDQNMLIKVLVCSFCPYSNDVTGKVINNLVHFFTLILADYVTDLLFMLNNLFRRRTLVNATFFSLVLIDR